MRSALLLLLFVPAALAHCSEIQTPTLDAWADSTTLSPGQKASLHVMRHFTGGPVDDVSTRVNIAVEPRSIITLAPSDDGQTLVVTPASDTGIATVTLTDKDDPAITTIRFTVVAAHIVSLHLDPAPTALLGAGKTQQFTATATMSDLTTMDVTKNVAWSSSNPAAATVGNAIPSFGLVTAIAEGDTTITATDTGTNLSASSLVLVRGDGGT